MNSYSNLTGRQRDTDAARWSRDRRNRACQVVLIGSARRECALRKPCTGIMESRTQIHQSDYCHARGSMLLCTPNNSFTDYSSSLPGADFSRSARPAVEPSVLQCPRRTLEISFWKPWVRLAAGCASDLPHAYLQDFEPRTRLLVYTRFIHNEATPTFLCPSSRTLRQTRHLPKLNTVFFTYSLQFNPSSATDSSTPPHSADKTFCSIAFSVSSHHGRLPLINQQHSLHRSSIPLPTNDILHIRRRR